MKCRMFMRTGSVFCEAQLFKQDALVIVETLIRNETEKLTHFEYIRDYHSYKWQQQK